MFGIGESRFKSAYQEAMTDVGDDDGSEGGASNLMDENEKLFALYQKFEQDKEMGFYSTMSEVGIANYFLFWRRCARQRRMNHIILEYELKVKEYDERMKVRQIKLFFVFFY